MRIQILPAHVANQIAAGEVIERPASVVKELLENAVDAGAKAIHVDIGFGGLNLIKVSDNGQGIVKDDLLLAVTSHATSKIKQLDDLSVIDSMGFRGEALASIASVSQLRLSSKPAEQIDATVLEQDEQGIRLLPCARSQGTTVEVMDLFYNAPVRKKFLKSERLEFQAIEMVVKRFALSAPEIALSLKHNGKELFSLPSVSCDQSECSRIKKIFGKTFFEQSIYIETEHEGMQLRGWLSSSAYQRSQRDKQWIYLNRRMIQDRLIQHAIQQAYQGVLHPGRYASCLVYLTIPADRVDVNVHPTKHEVRFQSPSVVHDFIVSSVSQALEVSLLSAQQADINQAEMSIFQSDRAEQAVLCKEIEKKFNPLHDQGIIHTPENLNFPSINNSVDNDSSLGKVSSLGRYLKTWYVINAEFVLVTRDPGIVYLIHAVNAYKALSKKKLFMFEDIVPSRPLLVPLTVSIQKKNHTIFEKVQSCLESLGIFFDFLSEINVLIRGLPNCLPQLNLIQLFNEIEQRGYVNDSELLEMIIACQTFSAYACHEEDKLELLDFIYQQDFPAQYCKHLDHKFCLEVMSDA